MKGQTGLTATIKLCTAHACNTSQCHVSRHQLQFPKTEILNESYTLIFSAVLNSTPVIFSQVDLKLMRILRDKNYQNWSSGFGEKCLVLFLRSDRYSVWGPRYIFSSASKQVGAPPHLFIG